MPFSVALLRKMDSVPPDLKEVLWLLLEEISSNGKPRSRKPTSINSETSSVIWPRHKSGPSSGSKNWPRRKSGPSSGSKNWPRRKSGPSSRSKDLAKAQRETTREIASLSRAHDNTRGQVGGLARTMAYALENEAYRMAPVFLKARHQLEISERMVRAWINGEEINFYARARRGGENVVIVGESVMRLDDRAKLAQLQRKLDAVRAVEISPLVPLLVTYFAHRNCWNRRNGKDRGGAEL